jgi:hypothetical protein
MFLKISPAFNKFSKIFPDRPVVHTGRFCISEKPSSFYKLFENFNQYFHGKNVKLQDFKCDNFFNFFTLQRKNLEISWKVVSKTLKIPETL